MRATRVGRTLAIALLFHPALSRAQEPEASPSPRPIRVCAGGDVTLGTNLDLKWARLAESRLRAQYGLSADPATLVAPLRSLFHDADIVLVNVETAVGSGRVEKPKCSKRSKNCFAFRSDTSAAAAFRSIGDSSAVVIGNVANNHARDAGGEGVDATIAHLTSARVLVTGADTFATPIVLAGGSTIAVLGFYTSTETPDARDLAAVRRHVARAVAMYGTVIVTAHIGAEGATAQRTGDSTEYFLESRIDRGNPVAFANAALDAGATLVIGHGPHVLRAAEWRDDRLVLYSLGNLATYGPFNLLEPMNRGVVACADLVDRQVIGAELRPTMQLGPGVVRPDPSFRALTLIDSLGVLDFPTTGARVNAWGELLRPLSPN